MYIYIISSILGFPYPQYELHLLSDPGALKPSHWGANLSLPGLNCWQQIRTSWTRRKKGPLGDHPTM